jgi:hypothetical protein
MKTTTLPFILFCLGVALAAMGIIAGCEGHHTVFRSLSPSQTAQDCWSHIGRVGSCTGDDKWGGSCSRPDGTTVQKDTVQDLGLKAPEVGFIHKHYPGTPPLNCEETYIWKSRAYVTFDLSTVDPKIESPERLAIATLSWEPSTKHWEQGWAQPNNIPPHCFAALFQATGPLKSLSTPGNLITQLDQLWVTKQTVTITPVVKNLLAAGGGQLRLFFTGSDEGDFGKENKSCETTLNSLKLDLTYSAK